MVSRTNGICPRALGARSIIGDSRFPHMQKNLNSQNIESFRPFAPSVLNEMLTIGLTLTETLRLAANIKDEKQVKMTEEQKKLFGIDKLNVKRSEIPAVTHVDYSARVQTVHKETNKKYYDLITKFKEKTDCPVIVNTSFNAR